MQTKVLYTESLHQGVHRLLRLFGRMRVAHNLHHIRATNALHPERFLQLLHRLFPIAGRWALNLQLDPSRCAAQESPRLHGRLSGPAMDPAGRHREILRIGRLAEDGGRAELMHHPFEECAAAQDFDNGIDLVFTRLRNRHDPLLTRGHCRVEHGVLATQAGQQFAFRPVAARRQHLVGNRDSQNSKKDESGQSPPSPKHPRPVGRLRRRMYRSDHTKVPRFSLRPLLYAASRDDCEGFIGCRPLSNGHRNII